MPNKNQVKSPMKKRIDGEIYSHEKRQLHENNIRMCKELSERTTKIRHIIKDPHTNEYYERIQIIHRPRRNQAAS